MQNASVDQYFRHILGKTSLFLLKKNMGRSCACPLKVCMVFVAFGVCVCHSNFKRDIVDTLCHASRRSDTIRPNKPHFLLQEGRVQRLKWLSRSFWSTLYLCKCLPVKQFVTSNIGLRANAHWKGGILWSKGHTYREKKVWTRPEVIFSNMSMLSGGLVWGNDGGGKVWTDQKWS